MKFTSLPHLLISLFTLSGFSVLLTSCSTISSPREERHKLELSVHKIRTELEDIKHDLNSSDIELHILEGKVIDTQDHVISLKQHMAESQGPKIDDIQQVIASIHKRLSQIERKQEEVLTDLRELGSHANQTNTALAQYKDKISEIEKSVNGQNVKFDELGKLRKNLDLLSTETKKAETFDKYTIKEGDSLQKISRYYNISVEELKKMNHLHDDLIIVGQELIVPSLKK